MINNTNEVRTERGTSHTTQNDGVTQGYAEVHGAQLYYERTGRGEPFVFLHAGIADHRMWATQFYALADRYTVIRYDLRGYGKSTAPQKVGQAPHARQEQLRTEQKFSHAQDLYSLLRTLEIGAATLIGSSLGGAAAIDFALEQPSMTTGLVLVGAVPSGYEFAGDMPPTLQRFAMACEQGEMDQAAELATQLWFDGPRRQPAQMDQDLRAQVKSMMTDVLTGSSLDLRNQSGTVQPAVNRLHEIMAPTVVVIGDQDDETVQAAANLLANQIPAADLVQMDGAAHLPNLEQPDAFYRIVVDFLDRIASLNAPESDLATGLGGAVERKLIEPEPAEQR
ncbi:MAG: alpha/beta hydrolase [Caldilineaceae bacterium]